MVQNLLTDGSSRTETPMDTISKDEIGMYSHHASLNRKSEFRTVILFSAITLLLASALAVLLPSYLLHANRIGDGYSVLFFVSFCSTVALLFLCMVRKIWDKGFHLWHGIVLKEVIKCGIVRSVCLMLIVYSFDENRVPCHLQEVLVSFSVVYAIVAEIIQLYKGSWQTRKRSLLSCLFLYAGIFLILAIQAANRYKCRGRNLQTSFSLDHESPSELWMTWSLVCLIAVVVLSWNSVRILSTLKKPIDNYYKKPHRLSVVTLVNAVSFVVILSLFWTDTFKTIGKGSSFVSFFEYFRGGIYCHFSTAAECGSTMLYGWLFIIFFVLYNFAAQHIFFITGHRTLPLFISGAGLALSTLWWYMLQLTQEGMLWVAHLDLTFVIWVVGFLTILASFFVYYKAEFKQDTDSSLFSSITKTETEV